MDGTFARFVVKAGLPDFLGENGSFGGCGMILSNCDARLKGGTAGDAGEAS
jgi:hypothetical protein